VHNHFGTHVVDWPREIYYHIPILYKSQNRLYITGFFRILIVGQPSGVLVQEYLAMIFASSMFRDLEVAKGIVRRLEDAGFDCVHADLS
jgi:predicted methyltransferase